FVGQRVLLELGLGFQDKIRNFLLESVLIFSQLSLLPKQCFGLLQIEFGNLSLSFRNLTNFVREVDRDLVHMLNQTHRGFTDMLLQTLILAGSVSFQSSMIRDQDRQAENANG